MYIPPEVSTSGLVASLQTPTSAQTKTMSPKYRYAPQPPLASFSPPPRTVAYCHSCSSSSSSIHSSSVVLYLDTFFSLRLLLAAKKTVRHFSGDVFLRQGLNAQRVIPLDSRLSFRPHNQAFNVTVATAN